MTHQDVYELAPEYVLGTLDEMTRARILAHLSGCPACRAEVATVSQTFDAVARTVPDLAPSAGLRDRILAIPAAATQRPGVVAVATGTPAAPVSGTSVLSVAMRIAAVAVLAVALWQWAAARQEVTQLRQRVAELQAETGDLLVARVSLEEQVRTVTHQTQVLRASDMITYNLAAQPIAAGAHARAYVSHKDGMVFTAEGLPAAPTGKVYQLWVIVNAKPISVGVFSPDATGRVHAVMDTPPINAMPGTVAVTLEPTGGLPQPSGAVYLAGNAAN
jgi:anti-sigma-K factor RskA